MGDSRRKNTEIYKRGEENFEISGVEGMSGDVIYTDDETEKLYVLDAANGRVVVLAKTGEYESQYMSEEMKKATGLVVDGKAGKIYLLAGARFMKLINDKAKFNYELGKGLRRG